MARRHLIEGLKGQRRIRLTLLEPRDQLLRRYRSLRERGATFRAQSELRGFPIYDLCQEDARVAFVALAAAYHKMSRSQSTPLPPA